MPQSILTAPNNHMHRSARRQSLIVPSGPFARPVMWSVRRLCAGSAYMLWVRLIHVEDRICSYEDCFLLLQSSLYDILEFLRVLLNYFPVFLPVKRSICEKKINLIGQYCT